MRFLELILIIQLVFLSFKLYCFELAECISYGYSKRLNELSNDEQSIKLKVREFCWTFGFKKSYFSLIDYANENVDLDETISNTNEIDSLTYEYERTLIYQFAFVIFLASFIQVI